MPRLRKRPRDCHQPRDPSFPSPFFLNIDLFSPFSTSFFSPHSYFSSLALSSSSILTKPTTSPPRDNHCEHHRCHHSTQIGYHLTHQKIKSAVFNSSSSRRCCWGSSCSDWISSKSINVSPSSSR